jgi:transposase-like protein
MLQVDAIWITVLRPNGQVRRDRKGRKRQVKGRFKVPILIAMGVWPDSDRCEILLWRQGESESAEEWVKFLEILEAQGIRGQNGLKLIIHDGGTGLRSALQTVWFDAEQQRCLFHKLPRRDFRLTVTYYRLEQQFPNWERQFLRTTGRLERFNRRLRRRTRAANAYHSNIGLRAMMAQEIREFHDAQLAR